MRRILVLLAAAALLGGCTSADPTAPGAARIDVDTPRYREMKKEAGVEPCRRGDADPMPGGLPDVTLPCLGGGPSVDLASLEGPLVLNFWQSTCGPCRKEMPVLQSFHEQYGDRVGVIGIDWQDVQVGAAMQLVQDTGVTYPLLADPQSATSGAAPLPRLRGMPFWVVVDANGTVVHQQYTSVQSERQLVAMLRRAGVDL
ncbi:MAG TPA: TlpA disulfide reductase family protein [Nocardioides sp.]|nr:TlpA disulfide reductase family protein [Nocardioides sp.]